MWKILKIQILHEVSPSGCRFFNLRVDACVGIEWGVACLPEHRFFKKGTNLSVPFETKFAGKIIHRY
jgi:hypothetical protein